MFNLTDDMPCPWCRGSIVVDRAARLCGHTKPECERWRGIADGAVALQTERARLLALILRAQVVDPESVPHIDAVECDRCGAPRGLPCRTASLECRCPRCVGLVVGELTGDISCDDSTRERWLECNVDG